MNKKMISYRLQQVLIFVLHIVLLNWMYYALKNSGAMTTLDVCLHFLGMAVYGGLLIRGCAYWGRYHYLKEIEAAKKNL